MTKETKIVGIAWAVKGLPTMKGFESLILRPDAVLTAIGENGKDILKIPLLKLAMSTALDTRKPKADTIPFPIKTSVVRAWVVPNFVEAVRLRFDNGEVHIMLSSLLREMRERYAG